MNTTKFNEKQQNTVVLVKQLSEKLNELRDVQNQLHEARNACEHIVIKNGHTYLASCEVCDFIFDVPYCEDSPTNLCDYVYYDGMLKYHDTCVYCKAVKGFY